ncbi:MAG: CBS domain-containing protein [Candidatus Bathyarchaeales archaeon]
MAGIIPIRDIMSTKVRTAKTESTIMEVVRKMNKFDVGSIVILDSSARPVGIVTERDILRKIVEPQLPPDSVKALQVMSAPLVTINADAGVEQAAKLMIEKRIKKLPVVDGGKLVGIITSMDIMRSQPKLISDLGDLICPYYSSEKK